MNSLITTGHAAHITVELGTRTAPHLGSMIGMKILNVFRDGVTALQLQSAVL